MRIFYACIVAFMVNVGASFLVIPLRAQEENKPELKVVEVPVAELDAQLAKERLRKTHGELSLKVGGDWLVTLDGRTEKWRWNAEKGLWICPADQKDRCAILVPLSFKWWGRGKGWMQEWSPVKREALEFGQSRTESAEAKAGTGSSSEDANGEEVKQFEGKKTADEVWSWKANSGSEARLYISMRDQRLERIDGGDGVERLEWFQKQAGSPLELTKILFDHQGTLVSMTRVR